VIRRQIVMPVKPEQLWEALTDPDQVAGWFGGRVEWELRAGAPAHFRGDDGRKRLGRIEAVRPGRHLRFRWWPAPDEAATATGSETPATPDASEISYILEPDGEGTRLTVQERQVGGPGPERPQACATVGGLPARPAAGDAVSGGHPGWTPWDDRLLGAWAGLVGCAAALVSS